MLPALMQADGAVALATLSLLEIVLGVDNLVVLSILVGHLPPARQRAGRLIGLCLAMLTRLALLFSIVWLTRLRAPWFVAFGHEVSPHDLILGVGGLILLAQSVTEIHATLERAAAPVAHARLRRGLLLVVCQIALIDVVFSLDSVFTAVGLARPDQVLIMAAAIVISVLVMMWVSGPVSALIERYPTVKVLALSFLVLIGSALIGQAFGLEVPKGYLYFAMAFALAVELVNIRLRRGSRARVGRD
jgi:predicted tellurium resistance membrane protein TerC